MNDDSDIEFKNLLGLNLHPKKGKKRKIPWRIIACGFFTICAIAGLFLKDGLIMIAGVVLCGISEFMFSGDGKGGNPK